VHGADAARHLTERARSIGNPHPHDIGGHDGERYRGIRRRS
jgi:hypothetical protein